MKLPILYPIFNFTNKDQDTSLLKKIFSLNIEFVQIRSKLENFETEKLINNTIKLRDVENSKTKIIINDYVDLVKKYDLDGVHLGQSDFDPVKAREILGDKKIIGQSCHNLDDLEKAPINVLNYLALGPIFKSKTKSGHAEVTGLSLLEEFTKKSPLPVVAIGGINQENFIKVLNAGASSFAVISSLDVNTVSEFIDSAKNYFSKIENN